VHLVVLLQEEPADRFPKIKSGDADRATAGAPSTLRRRASQLTNPAPKNLSNFFFLRLYFFRTLTKLS
jgi:hypothetical protein